MELLEQCQFWFEQEDAQKVIDALEVIPAGERTPELDSELAKAYIAIAEIGEREPYEKALELLKPHEEHFNEDHCWNYRMASAYYYLDEEGPALRYFEKALKAVPATKIPRNTSTTAAAVWPCPGLRKTSGNEQRKPGPLLPEWKRNCVRSWTPTKRISAAKS